VGCTTIEGRFQSLNVCLDVWSNRCVPEDAKIAEAWGADEVRIDANTAAAVIIRALLFMSLTGSGFVLGLLVFLRKSPQSHDFNPRTAGYFRLSHRVQIAVFPALNRGIFFWSC
jgi:hypothetical protein